jgi:PAS domain-containing protein
MTEREILERLADVLKDDIRFAGFELFDVLRKWYLIWSVLYLTYMEDEYEEVLGWLRDYLNRKMREEELIRRIKEMERIYEERFRQEVEEAEKETEEETEEKDGLAVESDELLF